MRPPHYGTVPERSLLEHSLLTLLEHEDSRTLHQISEPSPNSLCHSSNNRIKTPFPTEL